MKTKPRKPRLKYRIMSSGDRCARLPATNLGILVYRFADQWKAYAIEMPLLVVGPFDTLLDAKLAVESAVYRALLADAEELLR